MQILFNFLCLTKSSTAWTCVAVLGSDGKLNAKMPIFPDIYHFTLWNIYGNHSIYLVQQIYDEIRAPS